MKYAFITGAAGGLAGACVEELIRRGGWTVFAADLNVEGLNELVAKTSSDVIPVELNIMSMDSCNAAADKIREYTDHLDCIVNAAGIHTMASLVEEDPVGIISKMIDINVMGMIRVNKALFDLVDNCKGRIINFSSECGRFQPQPFNTPYAITKYAVEAYTIGLRRELNFVDIPVIKIQPGSFKTGMHGQATAGYDKLISTTTHYKPVLSVLKPIMSIALNNPHDKKYLVETVMQAMHDVKPKVNYKSKNTWYLALIDPIPAKIIDAGYKLMVNVGWKFMNKK
ncbi:MAG: SDR family NAD(P)-dependent oxidoreductase [Ruminococcaceae bacterium]|nr:SDR family NAD(P)-dependent oxidoreductase [Oscillospiraceae bacterium]